MCLGWKYLDTSFKNPLSILVFTAILYAAFPISNSTCMVTVGVIIIITDLFLESAIP